GKRGSDRALVARDGGEEFAGLFPEVDLQGVQRIAELVRREVEATPIENRGEAIFVTVSIGVAVSPHHASTAMELLARADAALYSAKQNGRNQVATAGRELPSQKPTPINR
ncbi:MAG: GGDEF domain-containing protein, partial [Planctomycetaceae bacterium]|nr:GGDEF domain-containing protein [Planctomycetaceae bacterium]